MHMQPVFKHLGHHEGEFPASEQAARRVMSLPMHPYLSEEQQHQVVEALAQAVA
jgi:UDP-2-acetamido-2-deoxy-ribo-hexuluronate aminotransferase